MQSLEAVSAAYNVRQRLIVGRAKAVTAQAWAAVNPADIGGTWSPQIARMVGVTMYSQRAAATGATEYVSAMLAAQGSLSAPDGQTSAAAFAESAADGRPLGSLLYQPVMRARDVIDSGSSTDTAYRIAGQQLQMIVMTEVADAGRQSMSTAMLANKYATGYYRNPGSAACARCAILAGVWSRTYEGAAFQRHPFCQCTAVPAPERANPVAQSPTDYFNGLSRERQDYTFGKGNAEMIRAGADPAAVINARRGMSGPGFNWTTTEGTTRHGVYGGYHVNTDGSFTKRTKDEFKRVDGVSRTIKPRLTPSAINRLSATREEAVAMLRENGYLLGAPSAVIAKSEVVAVKTATVSDVAQSLVKTATIAEPRLTSLTVGLAEKHGGEMAGLDFRLKGVDSLERKIAGDVAEKGITAAESGAALFDVNRYTMVLPESRYAAGAQATINDLRAQGATLKVKNYWNSADNPYQGINVQVISSSGDRFELQFHTPTSLDIKEGELHTIYEASRIETDPIKIREYTAQSFAAAAKIPIPTSISGVG